MGYMVCGLLLEFKIQLCLSAGRHKLEVATLLPPWRGLTTSQAMAVVERVGLRVSLFGMKGDRNWSILSNV